MTSQQPLPPPPVLREILLRQDQCPLLFSGCICDWPAMQWTVSHLAAVLTNKTVSCRLGLKNSLGVQWETECDYEDITLADYEEWMKGQCSPDNALSKYSRHTHWAYVDYKHMKDVFSSQPHVLKDVLWEVFGFPELDGQQSTIWIGSEKAYTLGHYDTYGCNLVAQISGRKRWILFPPDQTDRLYPTRVPFEESSVFSDISITRPDLDKHPKFQRLPFPFQSEVQNETATNQSVTKRQVQNLVVCERPEQKEVQSWVFVVFL